MGGTPTTKSMNLHTIISIRENNLHCTSDLEVANSGYTQMHVHLEEGMDCTVQFQVDLVIARLCLVDVNRAVNPDGHAWPGLDMLDLKPVIGC